VSLLSVVTLRQDLAGGAGTDDGSLAAIGQSLVAIRDWTFLLGPGLIPGVNALLLGDLMYRVRPGATSYPRAGTRRRSPAHRFRNRSDPVTVLAAIATAPIFLWELSLGVWLVVKGFKPSPITAGMVPTG
jgi:hypothetical protein